MSNEQQSGKMWSGRFREPLDTDFEAWQRSIVFDWRLLDQEVAASKAHASALFEAGILTKAETAELRAALDAIGADYGSDAGKELVRDHPTAEDIHHFVELKLAERVGELGLKLHTGRSRNEQIATDLRLYVRAQIELVVEGLADWASALVEQGRAAGDAVMPSYTHMQRAEPVLVAHWLLAYVEMALRDADRLLDCAARLNFCPLGSGAVAGATLPLDRTIAARELGFTAPTTNSIDATSDRDFILEYLQCAHVRWPAPQPVCRGDHAVRYRGIRLHYAARGIFYGIKRHAAEEESRSHRVDPRQSRAHQRRGAGGGNAAQRPAFGLQ